MANTRMGTTTQIASVGPSRPNSLPAYPSWNTSTVSPNDAPTDRQFNSTALSGTSSERNAMNSMAAVMPSTSPTVSGKRRSISCWVSTLEAAKPPTTTSAPASPRTPRATTPRTCRARSIIPASDTVSAGITSSSVMRRSALR